MAALTRVVAAVIQRGGRVLVAQRPPGKRHAGMWEFPGGKVESRESDAEALARELLEELGLRVISVERPLAELHDLNSEFLIAFVPTVVEGEPQCHEHSALRWATWDELEALGLAPTDARFARWTLSARI